MDERKTAVMPLDYLTEEDAEIFTPEEISELMLKTFEYLRTGKEPKFTKRIMAVRFRDHRKFFEENQAKYNRQVQRMKQVNSTRNRTTSHDIVGSRAETERSRDDIAYENEYENENENNENKKENKQRKSSFNTLIEEYTTDPDLRKALKEFLRHRTRIKAAMTDYTLKLVLNKLTKLGRTEAEKVTLINTAIEKGWKSVYPISEEKKNEGRQSNLRRMYDQAVEEERRNEEERNDRVPELPFRSISFQ